MNINRNNYESFFLLYADGELRADECLEVDSFIAGNEDLRIELEMLQAAVLPVEEIVFTDKSFLYRETIFDAALQEKLLLKIDNELAINERFAVNELISNNATAKKEFELLQRTKLDASEKIVFVEKHLLYKKEKDNVIAFGWTRWAAAAIFIGFGLFFGIKLTQNKVDTNTEVAVNTIAKPIINDSINNTKNIDENVATVKPVTENKSINSASVEKQKIDDLTKTAVKKENEIATVIKKEIEKTVKNTVQLPENNNKKEPIQVAKNEQQFIPDQKIISIAKEPVIIAAVNIPEVKAPLQIEKIVALENTYADVTTASVNNEKSENKILYIDEDAVKQSKAGGFFRKVKRFVERTANIKTGNTLQIAGFEIASR
jgi:hypothetical protein